MIALGGKRLLDINSRVAALSALQTSEQTTANDRSPPFALMLISRTHFSDLQTHPASARTACP